MRRFALPLVALIFGFAQLGGVAFAQSRVDAQTASREPGRGYPNRPIRIIVANTAGSGMDNVTRMIGQGLTEAWGQQVVVDNRPGAGGIIGHEIAAKAAPDGYTLLLAASAGVVISPLLNKVPYDSVRDFAPISLAVTSIQMLSSNPSVPAANVEELLAVARSRPGQLNCASSGSSSSNHLACEMLKILGHVDFVHVPFKGTVPQMIGLVSGQVQFAFASIPTTMTQVKPGKLRALAQGGPVRSPVIPDVPTVAETLPGFQAMTWYALFVPRATPSAIVTRLNAEVVKILRDPALAQRLVSQGLDPAPGTPAELTAYMNEETERFSRIIKLAGLKSAH
jgi:tripartite-type tricarboxylate transporter receptor subunit TctC